MKLVLIRHGESEWNMKNLFTGWSDVDLSPKGIQEAKHAEQILKDSGFDFDICYTSYLKRAIHTLNIVLHEMDRLWLPVIKTYKLNERHYGALQGLNKSETAEKYDEDQVKIWRRSFAVKPPILKEDSLQNPRNQEMYRGIPKNELPLHESLEDTIKRVVPYFDNVIKKDMLSGKRVLIAAHGNSIRALVKQFDNLSDEEIASVNIPTGTPLVYEFDEHFKVTKKYYLGSEEEIAAKIKSVSEQGSIKNKTIETV
ncbi:MAG: 2,3-diphosphoglycerate-dependent phosphoglycerate mutase [Inconstantimicrobium porci]|uniref:2,3-diphosphoglycerate-dependent phosphoglycerate mutase n=1 Tax=Inconstantimicrobium porci TaxID=2652291 RepID=UPI002A912471|nr:2,3-diphosphoglycerate-dependent phosphoglycerate mutase [Inconstantimicrobium porci]MDY5911826.1 2,3-diphosphoglycerate-dependent phosphoglycerate mutase [Inconstantimicrobium porci]